MYFGSINVILSYSDHLHASTTLAAIFRVEGARIQIYLLCVCTVILTHYKYICVLALTTLKMTTELVEA
jgi:hypothetical protein